MLVYSLVVSVVNKKLKMAGDIGEYTCIAVNAGPVYILNLQAAAPAPPTPPPQVLNIVPDTAGGFTPVVGNLYKVRTTIFGTFIIVADLGPAGPPRPAPAA